MERLKGLWPLLAAATLLLAAIGATIAAHPAQALKCSPVCLPGEEPRPTPDPTPTPNPTPAPRPAKHRVLVVNVGWGTGASENDAPLEPSALTEYVNHINGFVNEWFAQSAPSGTFPGWTATAGGSYAIRQPNIPSSACTESETDSFVASLLSAVHEKLERAGIDHTPYNLVAVTYSKPFCFGGLQTGNRVLLSHPIHTIHELGHYLGLANGGDDGEHPGGLRCLENGFRVPLSSDCFREENRDPYEVMSISPGLSFNPIYAKQLGWLNGQFFDVRAPVTGTWTIRPFIGAGHAERAIRLQDGATRLWIEYRRPIGIDGIAGSPLLSLPGPGSGVFIRHEVPGQNGPVSELLDMTPPDFFRPSLEVGQTWANPLGEATITLNSATTTGATITIGNRRTATVPNVIGLTPDHAAAVIAGAGLRSNGFTSVFDLTCGLIGVVAQQSPFAGTKVFPDSEVRIQVGERHPEVPCQ